MEYEKKVFYSEITRVDFEHKNNLYDLLNVIPAEPVTVKTSENGTCVFEPRCDKYYIPKKKSRIKVRTVKEIRNLFEQDNYSFIIEDMEKQQSLLLTKIRTGSATDDTTKTMANKLLNANHPISRTAWQMLNNINPDKNINPTQFVLCNGKRIRVVGSKGGKNKFICKHDLGKNNIEEMKKKNLKIKINKKHGLLRDSLNIKFKPGPLRRKKYLDVSHQKYHMGPVELVKLPKPALEIQPAYGNIIEPIMSSLLNELRARDGTITEKWAEFAVSVLGTVQNNKIVQDHKECCITFDLSYKCGQDRILMRRDISKVSINSDNVASPIYTLQNESDNTLEIRQIINKMMDSVEISLQQDSMYSVKNESQQAIPTPLDNCNTTNTVKEKNKKRYGELDKLAVTVIQLPVTPKHNPLKPCEELHCSFGCLCDSLNCTYKVKQHCGRFECMFGCKCELSKYKDKELFENDCAELIPGLMKLDDEINANLAKEEQKFHQTVVVSGDKSIFLKSRKRTSKSTRKYAEFYSSIRVKNEQKPKKILTVMCNKLNCANLEPWCMVHNLYKCFCKCRFTETSVFNTVTSIPNTSSATDPENSKLSDHGTDDTTTQDIISKSIRPRRVHRSRESSEKRGTACLIETNIGKEYDRDDPFYNDDLSCARTHEYGGRKYDDRYYETTNHKISEMEKNDTNIHKKLMKIIETTSVSSSKSTSTHRPTLYGYESRKEFIQSCRRNKNYAKNSTELQKNQIHTESDTDDMAIIETSDSVISLLDDEDSKTSTEPNIPFEISGDIYKPIKGHQISQEFLTPWIAKSYKNYKEKKNNGKSTLERPKRGKIILHLWECLLNRYKSRKNIFMTTTKRPFRIYIATQIWKPFFKDCVNIDAIRFSDLNEYPIVVKKLLTNASNKEFFCILGGWDDCWEIIGSVKKNDSITGDRPIDTDLFKTENSMDLDLVQGNWFVKEEHETMASSPNAECLQEIDKKELENNNLERSKWFLMKLEKDFSEIYCHKKGFYVEREKILHAIDLARATRKTVVINKQTCAEITNIPFGIYALPDTNNYCAVVGPYEIEEPLGLEIVKKDDKQKNTKGYWITTNKVDNIKVLDDPMSFLPSKAVQNELYSVMGVNAAINNDQSSISVNQSLDSAVIDKRKTKVVKPIKIRRTNGFYHLTPKNDKTMKIPFNAVTSLLDVKRLKSHKQIIVNDPQHLSIVNYSNSQTINSGDINAKSIACSENDNTTEKKKEDKKTGMFILKPEEINKKISDCNYYNKTPNNIHNIYMDMAIERFLSSTEDCSTSINDDVLLINGENNENNTKTNRHQWTEVWIECTTINNLGLIHGRKNENNFLSIDLPGLQPKDLYSESEAFENINQILAKKINIPNHIKMKWRVLTVDQASESLQTKRGILDINNLAKKYGGELLKLKTFKTCDKVPTHAPQRFEDPATPADVTMNTTSNIIEDLEETSRWLDNESDLLCNEMEKIQPKIIRAFSVPEELKTETSETLRALLTMNDNLVND